MELEYLRYFMKVAELHSVSKAAECFNISQPALSRIIAQLEAECRVSLFERKGRQMELTEAGTAFQNNMEKGLFYFDRGIMEARKQSSALAGKLRIGAYASLPLISQCISSYLQLHPEVKFLIRTNNAKYPQYDLYDFDFFFFTDKNAFAKLETVPLLTERFMVVVNNTHPLSSRKFVNLEELREEAWVVYDRDDGGMRDDTYDMCMNAGFVPYIIAEVDNDTTKMSLISSGVAIGLQPEFYMSGFQRRYSQLISIPIANRKTSRTIKFGWRKEQKMTPLMRDFRQYVLSTLKKN